MKNLRNVMLLFAASAAMIACQNNGKTAANAAGNDSAATDTVAVDTFVYEGEIPGADASSVYTLKLANDSMVSHYTSNLQKPKQSLKTIQVRRLLKQRRLMVKT